MVFRRLSREARADGSSTARLSFRKTGPTPLSRGVGVRLVQAFSLTSSGKVNEKNGDEAQHRQRRDYYVSPQDKFDE